MMRNGGHIETIAEEALVHVDRMRQRQVLRNLISNARKYGGPEIRLTGRVAGDMYEWVVADNGDGVPKEIEERLFQRFVHRGSLVTAPGGVGIGLSIVRALVEGMGGAIDYSRVGGWTEFRVTVPLSEAGAFADGDGAGAATTPRSITHAASILGEGARVP
jgi:signal transduction histidine kinase